MVLKTFNLDEETYKKFSDFCKAHGISMSNQINTFISAQIAEEPKVREEYLKKLKEISKNGKFIKFNSFEEFEKRYS
jgi:antitoxin component of RelBE/YafQ-DinJ toxin-antitoxin module